MSELGLEGVFKESELPLLIQRRGMAVWDQGVVRILDRRALPLKEVYVDCKSPEDVAVAIENMVIQGAFSISIAAGFGLALTQPSSSGDVVSSIKKSAERLTQTRPTGLALSRMTQACVSVAQTAKESNGDPIKAILELVERGAATLARQGWKTGQRLANLLPDGATILTHCFPDRSYAYMLMEVATAGKQLNVVCSETRPYMQGARLTALCAHHVGFKTSVITDGMGGFLMRRGDLDAFVTAADRVCMDGTVCNKIGTYQYALAAHSNHVPYYALRQSGPDLESSDEKDIDVEIRSGDALLYCGGERTAPEGVEGLYPSFDITPPSLVTAIVTDRGVFEPADIQEYPMTKPFVTDAIV